MNRGLLALTLVLTFAVGALWGRYFDKALGLLPTFKSTSTASGDPGPLLTLTKRNIAYPREDPGREQWARSYAQRQRVVQLPIEQAALILIDVWDTADNFSNPVAQERTENIIRTKIRPLLLAARKADLFVIHAPHRPIGEDGRNRSPTLEFRQPQATSRQQLPRLVQPGPSWPPVEFRYRVKGFGQFARFTYPAYMPYLQVHGIHPLVAPVIGKREVIASKPERVRRILAKHGILHLFYAGFNSNMCVTQRPVGIKNMSAEGYNTVLLRDATLGTEFDESVDGQRVTEASILDTEINYGFTTLASELESQLGRIFRD